MHTSEYVYSKMKAGITYMRESNLEFAKLNLERIEAVGMNISLRRTRKWKSSLYRRIPTNLNVAGNKCTYATASFSSRRSYYAFTCSGPDPATVTINDNNHNPVMIWNTNQMTRTLLSRRLMPQQRNFNITVNGYDCKVRLLLPPDFDESKSYAMMVFV